MVLTRAQSRGNLKADDKQASSSSSSSSTMQPNGNGTANGQPVHVKQAKINENGKTAVQQTAGGYDAAPRTTSYEFLGPPGAFLISTLVPFFTYFFIFGCDERGCPSMPFLPFMQDGLRKTQKLDFWTGLYDQKAMLIYLAWYAWTIACWAVLPGKWIQGGALRNGEKLWYKMNALQTFVASLAAAGAIAVMYGQAPFLAVYEHWTGLVTASILMSVFQATGCYLASFVPATMLAVGGNSGNILYDWFIGRSLNPRIGIFDIKTFNELRPGLILWFLLDICMAVKQYNTLGRITDSMILVLAFQGIYVVDAMYNEAGILTQMDITTDGFGFMLAVGDLTWVTFTYGLQTRYLALYPRDLGVLQTCAILATNGLGYYIFRVSNDEKNSFRLGRNPKNLTYMKTERGTNLLTSGWWGRSRHPNYFGDLIMALAWCLPCGFATPIPYYYFVYFAILLVHRQLRDDEACHKKYGKDWEKYCKIVRWRIVPGLY